MKKMLLALLFCTLLVGFFVTVIVHRFITQHGNNISIHVKESGNTYRLYALYSRNKTRRLQHYLDAQLSSTMFTNSRIKGNVSLDDHTNFYILANPGVLVIKLNKRENSEESYYRIKALGEGIKRQLAEN